MTVIELAISLGITVIFAIPQTPGCADTDTTWTRGCFRPSTPNFVYVDPRINNKKRYQVMVTAHEICHQQYFKKHGESSGEKYADDCAGVLMKKYNW